MSAFVVEPETIYKIISWLRHEFLHHTWLVRIADDYQVDVENSGWEQRLAQEMYALDVAAVNQRYNEQQEASKIVYSPYPYTS